MSSITYPDKSLLKVWVRLLSKPAFFLSDYLPLIGGSWYALVLKNIEQIQISFYPDDLYKKGAYLFFKIVENHQHLDSNKRSAVVVIYLFFIVNDRMFSGDPEEIRKLAKTVASREYCGKQELIDSDIEFISETFKQLFKEIL